MNAMHPLTSVSSSGPLGTMTAPKKVVIALNTTWNLVNFRSGLIRALIENGHEVIAVAPPDDYVPKLLSLGCRYVPMPMDTQGTHPGRDLILLWRFLQLMRRERPNVFLGYTIKPNIYGSLAARLAGVPVINNIAGLGAAFIRETWVTRVVKLLYRVALSGSTKVFFQNDEDSKAFVSGGIVHARQVDRLPGSGVDLVRFSALSPSTSSKPAAFRFLLIARLLWDKGVGEYVEAARQMRREFPQAEFCVLGFLDVQNPAAISRREVEAWVADGVVNYLGLADDVRPHLAQADCVVLPSYREGTPRSLLEAAAMARPIVTTNAPGCREVVDDGENGYLCKVRDAQDLADKMRSMLLLPPEQRAEMGRRGREKVEREFDEQIVITKYLEAIHQTHDAAKPAITETACP